MKFKNIKTKVTVPVVKTFAPKRIGNERATFLTDDEMRSMHKHKMGSDMHGKVSAPIIPHKPTMMFNSREG